MPGQAGGGQIKLVQQPLLKMTKDDETDRMVVNVVFLV